MKGASPVIAAILLILIVIGLGAGAYSFVSNVLRGAQSSTETPIPTTINVLGVRVLPPNWYIVYVSGDYNCSIFGVLVNSRSVSKVYREDTNGGCRIAILLDRYVEGNDVITLIYKSTAASVDVPSTPPAVFADPLDNPKEWTPPGPAYTFSVEKDCVSGACFKLETNITTKGTWSWMHHYVFLRKGRYIYASYMRKTDMVADHIPIAPIGSRQISQIPDIAGPPLAYTTNWVLRASNFTITEDSNINIALNAGWSADGNWATAWFDEFRIYRAFPWKPFKTLFSDVNNISSVVCIRIIGDELNVHPCSAVEDNVVISNTGGWIDVNILSTIHSLPCFGPFGLAGPAWIGAELEFSGTNRNVTMLLAEGNTYFGTFLNNCAILTATGDLNCLGFYPLARTNTAYLCVGGTEYYRNIHVAEIVPT